MDGLVRTTGWCIDQAREAPARKRDEERAEKVGARAQFTGPGAHAGKRGAGRAPEGGATIGEGPQRRPDAPVPRRGARRPAASPRRREPARFPVVGIGASAGGLEALEQFLKRVPRDSGMAFVIVQHLDPTHKGMMRRTAPARHRA